MKRASLDEGQILESWTRNADAWAMAVRNAEIRSRREVTNGAVVEAVMSRKPGSALDIGCGEGWLTRELARRGVAMIGIDAVPSLIEQARRAGGGRFHILPYEALADEEFTVTVDVAVCNFSLIGKASVEAVFRAVPAFLGPGGTFVIQTLHPWVVCGDEPYRDGWRAGSWDGFGPAFRDPAPWYFRTASSWIAELVSSGFRIVEVREPMDRRTGVPASVIFVAETQ